MATHLTGSSNGTWWVFKNEVARLCACGIGLVRNKMGEWYEYVENILYEILEILLK